MATPTPVYDTIRKCWQPMPPLRRTKPPEVIVAVTRDGEPARGVAVIATPLQGQCTSELGAMTDPSGAAWIVFREPGRYRITSGRRSVEFMATRAPRNGPPGFADVPRLRLRQP